MTQLPQVAQLAEMGVVFAGFIFYEKSPRYVVPHITGEALKQYDGDIKKVGVFVNETYDSIMRTVDSYGLNAVQLHGDETTELCEKLSGQIKTIKVFRVTGDEDLRELLAPYKDVVNMFLFDTKAKEYGGSGKKFNWEFLRSNTITKPYFLSGGIGPDDISFVKEFIKNNANPPYALDLNSKFEITPGVKDMALLRKFIVDR